MIQGHATAEGTRRFAARSAHLPKAHFRDLQGLSVSSIGLGTYLGDADDATDALQRAAIASCLRGGLNVLDCAINYRHMHSERAIGAALAELIGAGVVQRDEVVVATKGGFLPFDGERPADPTAYFRKTVLDTGLAHKDEIVGGSHCISPRWIEEQIDQSRANLGLETLDVYCLHNPEAQLEEVPAEGFYTRIRTVFHVLERAVKAGKIARYGVATWAGLRGPASANDHIELERLAAIAREVAGGLEHHMRVVQLPFNLAMPEALTVHGQTVDGEAGPALLAAKALGMSTMASAPLLQSKLARGLPPLVKQVFTGCRTDAQRALQFARSAPALDVALVGMKRAAHVTENLAVSKMAPASQDDFMRLFG
jgi:aryl-alcohol dehydrogenase-like predicted oxidoreductase